jgi:hypothetical protein
MIDLLRVPSATKSHHRIHLNAGFRADLHWWCTFAKSWNGVAVLANHLRRVGQLGVRSMVRGELVPMAVDARGPGPPYSFQGALRRATRLHCLGGMLVGPMGALAVRQPSSCASGPVSRLVTVSSGSGRPLPTPDGAVRLYCDRGIAESTVQGWGQPLPLILHFVWSVIPISSIRDHVM